jgi:hypothetical protein
MIPSTQLSVLREQHIDYQNVILMVEARMSLYVYAASTAYNSIRTIKMHSNNSMRMVQCSTKKKSLVAVAL